MNVFLRYFLSLCVICSTIFITLMLLGEPKVQARQMVFLWLILLSAFVFPMSCMFAYQATVVTIDVEKDMLYVKNTIDSIIQEKTQRTLVQETNERLVYSYQARGLSVPTKYGRWLTNSIVIKKETDSVRIETPRAYLKVLEACFR